MHAYRSAKKDGAWLTMREAAAKLGVTNHAIRRLIGDGIPPAEQVVPGAPWQIQALNLENDVVRGALVTDNRPRRNDGARQIPMFFDT
jgi:hypothetical protein